jgi:hypothetical protein
MTDMADNASRRGAANLGVPLMIAAFIVIGGFMYWLNLQAAEQEAAQMIEEETPEEVVTIEGAVLVDPVEIQLDATAYEGQMITLDGLTVASNLGTQGFWLEMPNGNPFLVALNADLMAQGATAGTGDEPTVTGIVLPVNDSVLDAWSMAGTISEGDRLAAEFATHFMDAVQVLNAGGTEEGAEGSEGGEG